MTDKAVEVAFRSMQDTLARIEALAIKTDGRVTEVEKRQAVTDSVMESAIERIDINTDSVTRHESWISEQRGGNLVRIQLIAQISTLVGVLAMLAKTLKIIP